MKLVFTVFCLIAMSIGAFAQDRGTLTGTISDQGGAVVPDATVRVTNVENGSVSTTASTSTGNYTLTSLPAGVYTLAVEVKGFKKSEAANVRIQVASTTRQDVVLQLGSLAETITVEATTALLKTENAEASITLNSDMIEDLPLNFVVQQSPSVRNPLAFQLLSPGVGGGGGFLGAAGGGASVNGLPANTFRILVEGQDTTDLNRQDVAYEHQASVESLQEFTVQSSSYSAEFGQAAGGVFNFTTKSGTNSYHGGVYEYFANDALNASTPYTGIRLVNRKHDFGGTFGGPVVIPKLYNGRNKTFVFFTYEALRALLPTNGGYFTVPNAADRAGDFSAAIAAGTQVKCGSPAVACKDALGNPVYAGGVYDPKSIGSDGITRLIFPGNKIPDTRIDPVARNIQALFPAPQNTLAGLNFQRYKSYIKTEGLPSIKVDHSLSEKTKLSLYWNHQSTKQIDNEDSLPWPLSVKRVHDKTPIIAYEPRLNVDHTIRPTLLLHAGIGFMRYLRHDSSPEESTGYDSVGLLGLKGASRTPAGFPRITGLGDTNANGADIGGMSGPIGPSNFNYYLQDKITGVAALTWVKGNHSYKFGGDYRLDSWSDINNTGTAGSYTFSTNQTSQPALIGLTSSGSPGLGYASFLLGLVNSASVQPPRSPQLRGFGIAFYAQDTWKVTRKLTLDYGLRYDYQNPGHEIWYRQSTFSSQVQNPNAGNLPGGLIFAGYGPGRCNCQLVDTYPYAFGPRLAAAYQIDSKTVARAGWGFFYGTTPPWGWITNGGWSGTGYDSVNFAVPNNSADSALPNGLQGGLVYSPSLFSATLLNPGAATTLTPGTNVATLAAPQVVYDRGSARPPRINQWNISLQREIRRGITVEAAYVGNRSAYLDAGGNNGLTTPNAVTPEILASRGLSLSNPANLTLLNSTLSSPTAAAAGYKIPFATYPTAGRVSQVLRPLPEYNNNLSPRDAALGNSWYDSLQTKFTVRLKSGLNLQGSYTYSKTLSRTGLFNDYSSKRVDANSLPHVLSVGFTYTTPKLFSNKFVAGAIQNWTVSGVLRYTSGSLLTAPTSNVSNLGTYLAGAPTQYMTRVQGEPLYLNGPNGDIDPTKQLFLNPKAWTECGGLASFGCGSPVYNDFRTRRFPAEQLSAGRRFNLPGEKHQTFEIRAEFSNVFNRLQFPNVTVGNPTTNASYDANGNLTGGFGFINYKNVSTGSARTGQIVARYSF